MVCGPHHQRQTCADPCARYRPPMLTLIANSYLFMHSPLQSCKLGFSRRNITILSFDEWYDAGIQLVNLTHVEDVASMMAKVPVSGDIQP
jgi:hypothetical protein